MNTGSNIKLNQLIKNDHALRPIRLPKTNTDRPIIANEVWGMYHEDYHLAVRDIAKILDCNISWVYENIVSKVEHIFITHYMRNMLHEFRSPSRKDPSLIDFYYFSEISLRKWLKENTKASTKTILTDIREIAPERMNDYNPPSFRKRKEHTPVFMNPPLPKNFYSLTTIREKLDISTKNSAYRYLFNNGEMKYIIADSLVRYSPTSVFRIASENDILIWADEAQHHLTENNQAYLHMLPIEN